jgi:hypothetical protein
MIFLWRSKSEGGGDVFNLVAFFIIIFMINNEITYYTVYLSEVLPTQARVIGYSIVLFFGYISVIFADLIITLCKNSGFSVMIIFSICSFVKHLHLLVPSGNSEHANSGPCTGDADKLEQNKN